MTERSIQDIINRLDKHAFSDKDQLMINTILSDYEQYKDDTPEVVHPTNEENTTSEEYSVAYENDNGDVTLIGLDKCTMEDILHEMESIIRYDNGRSAFLDEDGKSYLLHEDGTKEYFTNRYFIVSRSFSPWVKETRLR